MRITDVTKSEAVVMLEGWIRARAERSRAAFIVNAHTLNLAWEDPGYRAVLNAADVVLGDGSGVRLAARVQGVRVKDNLVGTDLLPEFLRTTVDRGYRYFLLGADSATVARAAARLERDFPSIRLAGHHHGYVTPRETPRVIDLINDAAPDLLLVGMGNPLQERFIHDHLRVLRVPVSIGVGGLFDHWGGNLRRAPRWVRGIGLEWVQLLLQQPRKWRRYVLGNPKFVCRAIRTARGRASGLGLGK